MSNDKSLKPPREENTLMSSNAEDWGWQFVKHLEIEFEESASSLGIDATRSEFQRAMMLAVLKVFSDSGMSSEDVVRLMHEVSIRPPPGIGDGDPGWSAEKNARRFRLVDKKIQHSISLDEEIELNRLTEQMRTHLDREEMVPLEGARQLHQRLLEIRDSRGTAS